MHLPALPLILIMAIQFAICDRYWWPLTWLKIGMEPYRIPTLKHRVSHKTKLPKHLIELGKSNEKKPTVPLFWREPDKQKIKTTIATSTELTTDKPTSAPTIMQSNSECNNDLSSNVYQPHRVFKWNNASKFCVVGGNCQIYTKSFLVSDPLFQYAYFHSTPLEPLLRNIYESTRESVFVPPLSFETIVAPEVVKLCMALIKAVKATRVLVVGVFTGLSVVGAALSVEHDGQVVGVEDPKYIKFWNSVGSKQAFKADLEKIISIQANGPITSFLDRLSHGQPRTFDFILLDDINMDNYVSEYESALKLLRPRGIMMINDVFAEGGILSGEKYRDNTANTMLFLNKKIRNDIRLESAIVLPFGGGIFMIVKK